jgi:hypothetical protein
MSTTSRPDNGQAEELPADIVELADAIQALPDSIRQQIAPVMERVVESTRRRRRILYLVQDALSQLRLDMKYLVFDLEATRRERDQCRHERSKPDERGPATDEDA